MNSHKIGRKVLYKMVIGLLRHSKGHGLQVGLDLACATHRDVAHDHGIAIYFCREWTTTACPSIHAGHNQGSVFFTASR